MENRTIYDRFLTVQPGWKCRTLRKEILTDETSGTPLALLREVEMLPGADSLDCVPGVGLTSIAFSLDPGDRKIICFGVLSERKKVPMFGMRHMLTCQFFPGEFTRIFGISCKELTDREVPLEEFIRTGSISEQIHAAETFDGRMDVVRRFVREWEHRTQKKDAHIMTRNVMRDALRSYGNLRLSELAEQTGYSTRYLQKMIIENVGLTPKAAMNNIRFQNALRILLEEPNIPLSELAVRSDYYDQSHFTKVFREYMGMTPAAFQKQLLQSLR